MKLPRSIRWRIQLWYGVLLGLLLSGFGATAYQLERNRVLQRIDDTLQQRLPLLVEAQHPAQGPDRQLREFTLSAANAGQFDRAGSESFYYVVWLRHGIVPRIASPTVPADVPMPAAGAPTTRQRGEYRETFLFPGPGDCVLVGRSVSRDFTALQQLQWTLIATGILILMLGIAVGAWMTARALKPIAAIGRTAEAIASGDLTRRIPCDESQSELGQLSATLNATFSRLEDAFAQQARFTADAAHELRTPVSVLLTHSENGVSADCANPEHREAFEAIRRSAHRMRRLVTSLLELARLDAGQERLERHPVDLAVLALETLNALTPLADSRGIVIESDLAPAFCSADAERLSQVVINLITNALVHNRTGGSVRVETRSDSGAGVLVVSDKGPGIAETDLPRVFERFFRGDVSRSAKTGGTGLGLAISKAIVDAHGGTITVESRPGVRTAFTVRIPPGAVDATA